MPRIEPVEPQDAGMITRFAYRMAVKKVGKVIMPMKIHAHHPKLFRADSYMEIVQTGLKSVDPGLKSLASIKAATLIGCPF